ncbi:hypothetical protein XarjCFBP7653_05050 [Xanthomonas arboricola]|nr:hypothetical protein XarjCFBP7653_05050 [Xanthomonas arboricola]
MSRVRNSNSINAPSVAPALLAFDRSTAGSDGTDSAVPAIENLPQPSVRPFCHQPGAAGRRNQDGPLGHPGSRLPPTST